MNQNWSCKGCGQRELSVINSDDRQLRLRNFWDNRGARRVEEEADADVAAGLAAASSRRRSRPRRNGGLEQFLDEQRTPLRAPAQRLRGRLRPGPAGPLVSAAARLARMAVLKPAAQ